MTQNYPMGARSICLNIKISCSKFPIRNVPIYFVRCSLLFQIVPNCCLVKYYTYFGESWPEMYGMIDPFQPSHKLTKSCGGLLLGFQVLVRGKAVILLGQIDEMQITKICY
jgi:hypothetical protein